MKTANSKTLNYSIIEEDEYKLKRLTKVSAKKMKNKGACNYQLSKIEMEKHVYTIHASIENHEFYTGKKFTLALKSKHI